MVGLPVCLVYRVIKFPIWVIEPAKRNRVLDSSVGYYPGTWHGPSLEYIRQDSSTENVLFSSEKMGEVASLGHEDG